MTEVIPGLFVGSFAEASDEQWLATHRVTHVLNMARELPEYFPNRFVYKKIPMDDAETCKMTKYFREIVEFIDSALSKRKTVLVHCMMGISRSVTAVLVYLIEKKGMELSAARKLVKSKRPQVKPNRGFITQLINYEITQLRRHPHSDKEASPFKMHKSILNSQSPKQPAGQSILASLVSELENTKLGMNPSQSQTKLPPRSTAELITGPPAIKLSSAVTEPIAIMLHPKELLRPSKNLIEYVTSKGIFGKRSRSNPSCNSPKDSSKSRGETLDEYEIRQYPTHKNFSSFEHHGFKDRSLLSSSSPVQLDDAADPPVQERLSLQSKPLDGQETSIFQKLKTKSILANSTLVCLNPDNKQTKSSGSAITQVVMKKIQDRKDYSTKPSELLLWHEDGTKTSKFQSMGNYDASTKSSLHPHPKTGGEPTLEMKVGQHRDSLEHIGLDVLIGQPVGQNMNLQVKLPSKENFDLESPLRSPNRILASTLKQASETPKLTIQERLDVFRSKNTIESVPKFFNGLQKKEGKQNLVKKLPSEEYMHSTQTNSVVASPPKRKKVSPISMQAVEGIPSPKRTAPLDSKNESSRIQEAETSSNKITKISTMAGISSQKPKGKPMMNKFSIGNVSLPLCQEKSVNTAGSKTPSSVFIKGGRVIAKDSLTSPKQPAYSSVFSLTRVVRPLPQVIDHENLISSLALAGGHSKPLAQKEGSPDQIPKKGITKCFSKKASETQIKTIKDLRKGDTQDQPQDLATKPTSGGSPGLQSASHSISKDKKPLLQKRVMASLVESTAKLEEASTRFLGQKGVGGTYLRYSQPNIRKPVAQKLGSGTDSRIFLYQEEKKQALKEGSLNIYNLKSPANSNKKPDIDEASDASFKNTFKVGNSGSPGVSSPSKGILKSSSFADRKLSLNEPSPPSRFQRVSSILKGVGMSPSRNETWTNNSGVNSPPQLLNPKQTSLLEQSVSSIKGMLSTNKPIATAVDGVNNGAPKPLTKQAPLGTISQHHKYFLGFAGISRTDPAEPGRQKKPLSAQCWEPTKPFI